MFSTTFVRGAVQTRKHLYLNKHGSYLNMGTWFQERDAAGVGAAFHSLVGQVPPILDVELPPWVKWGIRSLPFSVHIAVACNLQDGGGLVHTCFLSKQINNYHSGRFGATPRPVALVLPMARDTSSLCHNWRICNASAGGVASLQVLRVVHASTLGDGL